MNQNHDIIVMLFDINFDKWFDKPGNDDWVVVGVGEVGALVVPAGEVPYHNDQMYISRSLTRN